MIEVYCHISFTGYFMANKDYTLEKNNTVVYNTKSKIK